jgi:methyl-accepting chemotaxis protein-1 (serine sensor receptor)
MEIFLARERMALDRAALAPDDPKMAPALSRAQGVRLVFAAYVRSYVCNS